MNIDKIITGEIKYNYLDRVRASLRKLGLTFEDLKNYKRAGRSYGTLTTADTIFKGVCGNDAEIHEYVAHCLCGKKIHEQCYICPIDSSNSEDIIVLGNHCIKTFGFINAIRGKGKKIQCVTCGSIVNKSGFKRHCETSKCKNHKFNLKCETSSDVSTSIGSDSV